jgi:hypothetical protein
MIEAEFNSETVYLLTEEWDGRSEFDLTCSLVRDTVSGLTQREARRPYSQTLRCAVKYAVTVHSADLQELTTALRVITTERVVLPVWPLLAPWSDRGEMQITGGLMIAWTRDWSQWEIYTPDAEPEWPAAGDMVAPALLGHLEATSQPELLSPDAIAWEVRFVESSAPEYALQVSAPAAAEGPQPAGYAAAPRLLPFHPDFSRVTDQVNVEVKRERLGLTREDEQEFHPHYPWRSQRATYTLSGEEPAQILRFFLDYAAPGASFWAASWLAAAELTADAGADVAELDVSHTHGISVGEYLAIYTGTVIARRIAAKTDDTITLSAAAGVALSRRNTLLLPLCLARLDKPEIALTWLRPGLARCEINWSEVLPEATLPADETLGTSIGRLPLRVVLYEFRRDLRNGTVLVWRYTSHESPVTYNGQTYEPAPISLGDITQSLNLENDGCQITTVNFEGNPMIEDVLRRAEAPLNVTILFGDIVPAVEGQLIGVGGEGLFGVGGEAILPVS